jgi:hypothetical protein
MLSFFIPVNTTASNFPALVLRTGTLCSTQIVFDYKEKYQ